MKRGFRVLVALVLSTALFLPASPALACCEDDDFWCWAAAVATGGVSCAVENLINSIKDLIRDVNTLARTISTDIEKVRQAGVGGVQGTGDDLKNLAQQAQNEYSDARRRAENAKDAEDRPASQANQIAAGGLGAASTGGASQMAGGSGLSGGSSAKGGSGAGGLSSGVAQLQPASADPKALKDAMNRGQGQVSEQQGLMDKTAAEARSHAENAKSQAVNAADVAGKIAMDVLLAPLSDLAGMLTDLVKHPDRLFNPAALVDDQVKRVTAAIDSELNKLADAIARDSKASLDASSQKAKDAGDTSSAAKAIADQMEKLHKSRTQADLDRLNAMLPRPSVGLLQHFAAPALFASLAPRRDLVSKAFLKAGAGKSKSMEVAGGLNSKLKTSWNGLQKQHQAVLHPVPVPGAEEKFKQKFEAMFKGLTKAQADAKRNELLAEARRRFAGNPKALSQTQSLINQRAKSLSQRTLAPGLIR
jgi:hypothetical protein